MKGKKRANAATMRQQVDEEDDIEGEEGRGYGFGGNDVINEEWLDDGEYEVPQGKKSFKQNPRQRKLLLAPL